MKTSADGRAFIEAFEGKFLHAYDDGTGVTTIGFGHTTMAGPPAVYRGQTITDAECDAILASDLGRVEANVSKCITVSMGQAQFDALVSFDFNTGALAKSSIPAKINAGNYTSAMSTLLMYDHAKGKQMDGLTRRRKAERLMFLGQVQQALRLAGAHAATPDNPMPQKPERAPPAPTDLNEPDNAPNIGSEPPQPSFATAFASLLSFILSLFKGK